MAIKQSSLKKWYWIWILSIILFYTSIILIRRAPVSSAGTWFVALGIIVLVGFIAFLLLSIGIVRSLKIKSSKRYGLVTLITFFTFFLLLSNYEKLEAKLGFSQPQADQTIQIETHSIVPSPTESPTTINRQKQRVTSPPPDKNVVVKCSIHPNCGGGYREMNLSSCDQMTCCRVLDGSYSFISKSRCTEMYNDAETTLKNTSQEWIDYWNKQGQPTPASPTNISLDQLKQEQKQRCLKEAEAMYYSNLRTCAIYRDYYNNETMARECESKYYQQYIKDKGACN